MRRSIFNAGVWTALGLAIAFAIVSANSHTRRAVTKTTAPVATATVASHDDCASSDVCCARESKVTKAAVAVAPRKKAAAKKAEITSPVMTGAAGMVVGIDPESGELTMPNAQQLRELQNAAQGQVVAPSDPGTEMRFPNGAIGSSGAMEADYATVHIDATGKRVFGHAEATAPVQPAKPALEEK